MTRNAKGNAIRPLQSQRRMLGIGFNMMHFQFNRFALSVSGSAPLTSVSVSNQTVANKGFVFRFFTFNNTLRRCAAFPVRVTVALVTAFSAKLRRSSRAPFIAFHCRSAVGTIARNRFTLPIPMLFARSRRFADAGLRDFAFSRRRCRWVTNGIISERLATRDGTELTAFFPSGNKLDLAL